MWWLSTANLPSLILLTDDLFKVHKLKPNLKWRQAFEMYLKSMPPYFLLVRCSSFLLKKKKNIPIKYRSVLLRKKDILCVYKSMQCTIHGLLDVLKGHL